MAIEINKAAAVYKPSPVAQVQQQQSLQQSKPLQAAGADQQKKPQESGQSVSLTLSKEGQQLAQKPSAVSGSSPMDQGAVPGKPKASSPVPAASYGSSVGAAATRSTAVKSQLEALQNKQAPPAAESNQKGNTIV